MMKIRSEELASPPEVKPALFVAPKRSDKVVYFLTVIRSSAETKDETSTATVISDSELLVISKIVPSANCT